jgi:hypothetical protein
VGTGCPWQAQERDDGPLGLREGEGCGRAREGGEAVWTGSGPALFFYFLFLFSISISFISFSFEQKIAKKSWVLEK